MISFLIAACALFLPVGAPTGQSRPTATLAADAPTTLLPPHITPTSGTIPSATLFGSRCSRPPASEPDSLVLAFVAEWDGDSDIYTILVDGSTLVELTDNTIEDYSPVWSPGGSKIAFRAGRISDRAYQLRVMSGEGHDAAELAPGIATNPGLDWSADGLIVVFSGKGVAGVTSLYLASLSGTPPTTLVEADSSFFGIDSPWWAPDDSLIAFTSSIDEKQMLWRVFTVGSDGSDLRQLTSKQVDRELAAGWHPKEDLLLVSRQRDLGSAFQLIVVNPHGSYERQLTHSDTDKLWATWSPDGELIAYVEAPVGSSDPSEDHIRVMSFDTGENVLVAQGTQPRWAPNGRHIAYLVDKGDNADLYVIDICESIPQLVVENISNRYAPDWRPLVSPQD